MIRLAENCLHLVDFISEHPRQIYEMLHLDATQKRLYVTDGMVLISVPIETDEETDRVFLPLDLRTLLVQEADIGGDEPPIVEIKQDAKWQEYRVKDGKNLRSLYRFRGVPKSAGIEQESFLNTVRNVLRDGIRRIKKARVIHADPANLMRVFRFFAENIGTKDVSISWAAPEEHEPIMIAHGDVVALVMPRRTPCGEKGEAK